MFLLCGLGNPGKKYAGNRHNVGFMAINTIASQYGLTNFSSKFHGEYCKGNIEDEEIILLKPSTFMNKSGVSVAECTNFFKVPLENIWVFYDELDLPTGKLRLKRGGGSGGHNGIRSIDQHLPKDYGRVRIGIDHPGRKEMVTGYVLGDFTKEEQEIQQKTLSTLSEHIGLLLQNEPEKLMTAVAREM